MTSSALSELDSIIGGAEAKEEEVAGWLSTGFPQLNKILSGRYAGGFAYGRMYEVYGPSSSGKTVIACNAMIEAQKAGGVVILADYERAFMVELARKMGLNTEKPHFIHLHPQTWEEGNTLAMRAAELIRKKGIIDKEAPILFVLDSIAAAVPKSMVEKELDELSMNDTTALARVTSTTLKVVNSRGSAINMTSVFLNQIRTKPGVAYGDPTTTPGGVAMEFYATARLAVGRKKIMDKGESGEKEMTGQLMTLKTVKNKLTRPFQETELYFMFNEDGSGYFDTTRSMLDYLIKKEVIKKSGARVTWTDGKSYYASQLIEKIEKEGLEAELFSLLPAEK